MENCPPEIIATIFQHCDYASLKSCNEVSSQWQELASWELKRRPTPLIGLYLIWSLSSKKDVTTHMLRPYDSRHLVIHKAIICSGQPDDDLFKPWWSDNVTELRADCWIFDNVTNIQNQRFSDVKFIYSKNQLFLRNWNTVKQAVPWGCSLSIEFKHIKSSKEEQYDRIFLPNWRSIVGVGHHRLK